MKKLTLLLVLALVTGALAGCGSGSGGSGGSVTGIRSTGSDPTIPGSPEDRAAVLDEATRHPEFMEEALSGSNLVMSDQPAARGAYSIEATINPVSFSRRVRVASRSFEFAFADTDSTGRPTSAILTVHKELTGTLRILAADTTGSFNPPVTISKPISETWTRRLQFVRDTSGDGDDDDDDRGHGHLMTGGRDGGRNGARGRWQLVAVSAIQITTPNGEAGITSLQVQTAGSDTTLSDPLALVPVGGLPTVPAGTEVTLTATTPSADDIVLLLVGDRRIRLQSNGGGTHTGTFVVPNATGAQHFGLMVLTHDTLYDDTAPYDAETWLVPVVVGNAGLANAQ